VPRIRVTFDVSLESNFLNVTILDEQTGQYNNAVFNNEYEEMVPEIETYENNFSPEKHQQHREYDKELYIKAQTLIAEYVVPGSNLSDSVSRVIRYLWLSKESKREIDQLKLYSRNKLTLFTN
jgi:hypothetical protein